jgi:hypothetical protein
VQRQSRDQKTLELLRFDALTAAAGADHRAQRHWVPLHHELTFLQHAASSSGRRRATDSSTVLYTQRRQAAQAADAGEYMVAGERRAACARVDERARAVYFTANLPSPSNGSCTGCRSTSPASRSASREAGTHGITMSMNARVFVDTSPMPTRRAACRCARADGKP